MKREIEREERERDIGEKVREGKRKKRIERVYSENKSELPMPVQMFVYL